jgi:hypothetical protein
MGEHKRTTRSSLFGKPQELAGKFESGVAIECRYVPDPRAVEDGEQQQRVLGRLTKRVGVLDQ